jgi:hypothetical protein
MSDTMRRCCCEAKQQSAEELENDVSSQLFQVDSHY